jgi:hypothetical protein
LRAAHCATEAGRSGCGLLEKKKEGRRRIGLIEKIEHKMAKRFRNPFSFL